ncbi:MAG TPA: CoB--CoM heterodisulfide reductase iron-sulfur subunit B family protein [Armatimonadota bacterium]|nr:CoB--CoM heterodisulfide reductase iron-sulfur subunit B family protein [Armatimonadota bacterium]
MPAYSYFPGCSLSGTSKEYGASTVEVCRALGIELTELEDWNCCGATSGHSASREVADALGARNVLLATDMGLDLVAPCAACYNRTKRAANVLAEGDAARKQRIAELLGRPVREPVRVLHLLEVFSHEEVAERLGGRAMQPLPVSKVAAYYGCLLVRPPKETGFDDPENPQTMDRLLRLCGLETCDWYFKNECCGASHSIPQSSVVLTLVDRIIRNARAAGAEWIVTACPLCQVNLDTRQQVALGEEPLPVLYITQVLGLALGLSPKSLGVPEQLMIPRVPAGAAGGGR